MDRIIARDTLYFITYRLIEYYNYTDREKQIIVATSSKFPVWRLIFIQYSIQSYMLNEQKRTDSGRGRHEASEEMSSFHLHRRITPENFALGGSLPGILRRTGNAVPVGGTQHRLAMLSHEGASSSSMGDDPHESNSALVIHLC